MNRGIVSGHTDKRYEEDLSRLRRSLVEMGGLVERQIGDAVRSFLGGDRPLGETTIVRDHEVNHYDVDVDDQCLRLLALHQPAARDLRFITTVLKITTDLERIGDLAVNVCERGLEIGGSERAPALDLLPLADLARRLLRESLDAFVHEDVNLALKVCQDDDEVDAMHRRMVEDALAGLRGGTEAAVEMVAHLFVSKYLERIGDHATNIAEMVVFLVKGRSIRHVAPPTSIGIDGDRDV